MQWDLKEINSKVEIIMLKTVLFVFGVIIAILTVIIVCYIFKTAIKLHNIKESKDPFNNIKIEKTKSSLNVKKNN